MALQIGPAYAEAHNNLGVNLIKRGDIDEAIFRFKEALRIKPDFKDAENNLEIALKKAGKD